MKTKVKYAWLFVLFVMMLVCFLGCAKGKKEANLQITDSEFIIRQDSRLSYVLDAKGTIRNAGEVDVKNVKVTAYCRSCGDQIINAVWFISDVEKMPNQMDVISYLPAGASEDFEFEEVAFFSASTGSEKPQGVPEDIEIVIESYEIAE
jgi:hypothetical protein